MRATGPAAFAGIPGRRFDGRLTSPDGSTPPRRAGAVFGARAVDDLDALPRSTFADGLEDALRNAIGDPAADCARAAVAVVDAGIRHAHLGVVPDRTAQSGRTLSFEGADRVGTCRGVRDRREHEHRPEDTAAPKGAARRRIEGSAARVRGRGPHRVEVPATLPDRGLAPAEPSRNVHPGPTSDDRGSLRVAEAEDDSECCLAHPVCCGRKRGEDIRIPGTRLERIGTRALSVLADRSVPSILSRHHDGAGSAATRGLRLGGSRSTRESSWSAGDGVGDRCAKPPGGGEGGPLE